MLGSRENSLLEIEISTEIRLHKWPYVFGIFLCIRGANYRLNRLSRVCEYTPGSQYPVIRVPAIPNVIDHTNARAIPLDEYSSWEEIYPGEGQTGMGSGRDILFTLYMKFPAVATISQHLVQ